VGDVSQHFDAAEFSCRCRRADCDAPREVHPDLPRALEVLRERCGGRPVGITSGIRCAFWNAKVGGSQGSLHLRGAAADVHVAGMSPVEVRRVAERIPNIGGIGLYDTWLHIDVRRGGRTTWDGRRANGGSV
jgi:uncharacterized protein YcbK (DUF882 family)